MAEDTSRPRAASDEGLVEREVGSLALSEIEGSGAMALMRAIGWNNVLARLGIAAPLVVVHDVGCLVAGIGRPAALSRGLGDPKLGESWRELLVEFAEDDQAENLPRLAGLVDLMDRLGGTVVEAVDPAFQARIWGVRTQGLNIMMSMREAGKPVSWTASCPSAQRPIATAGPCRSW